MKEGDIIKVRVNEVQPGYAKVDYNGQCATLQLVDVIWAPGPVNMHKFVAVGDLIEVKVTKIIGNLFSISLREVLEGGNPWLNPPKIGQTFHSSVSLITEYGVFFDITPYCRALLHIDNTKRRYKIGDIEHIKVKSVNVDLQKVELDLAT